MRFWLNDGEAAGSNGLGSPEPQGIASVKETLYIVPWFRPGTLVVNTSMRESDADGKIALTGLMSSVPPSTTFSLIVGARRSSSAARVSRGRCRGRGREGTGRASRANSVRSQERVVTRNLLDWLRGAHRGRGGQVSRVRRMIRGPGGGKR